MARFAKCLRGAGSRLQNLVSEGGKARKRSYGRSTFRLYAISSMKAASSPAPLLWSNVAQRSAIRCRSSGRSRRSTGSHSP